MAYDKDPCKGPVGKDGKPVRTLSAYATGASGNSSNPYESLTTCSFGNHISCWQASCKDGSERCMICHNTSNKPAHHSKDCPILKKIGLKLAKRTLAGGGNAVSRVRHETPPPAPPTAPPAAPNPPAKNEGLQGRLEHLRRPRNPTAMTCATNLITKGNMRGRFIATVILNPMFLFTHAPLMPPLTSRALTSHPSPPVAAAPLPPSTQRVSAQFNFQSLSPPFSTTLRCTPLLSCPTSFGLAQVSLSPILAQRIT
jgi:hypothetical protein